MDINSYALQIELSLNTNQAFDSLDDFGDRLVSIETKVADAAKVALGTTATMIDNVVGKLGEITTSLGEMGLDSKAITKAFARQASNAEELGDNIDDQLKQYEEYIDLLEQIDKFEENRISFMQDELTIAKKIQGGIEQYCKIVEQKNVGHETELGLVRDEADALNDQSDAARDLSDNWLKISAIYAGVSYGLYRILGLLKNADELTNKFNQAFYRVYGTQRELADQARLISREYSILDETAAEAMDQLIQLKMPRDQLEKLTGVIGRANHVTGVGIEQYAQYAKSMRDVGYSAEATTKHIQMMTAAQRKFGLTTSDVDNMINRQNKSAYEMALLFGKDAPQSIMTAELGLRSLAKGMIEQEEVVSGMMDVLTMAGIEGDRFWNSLAGLGDESRNINKRIEALLPSLVKLSAAAGPDLAEALKQGNALTVSQELSLTNLAKIYGTTKEQIKGAIALYEKANATNQLHLLSLEGIDKALGDEIAKERMWEESINTLLKQLSILSNTVTTLITDSLQPAIAVLSEWVTWLNQSIQKGGELYQIIQDLKTAYLEWYPWIKNVVDYLRPAVGYLTLFGMGVLFVGGTFGVFSGLLKLAQTGIIETFRAIGNGLLALGTSIRSVMVPLLALGATFAMVGVGAYFFGESVVKVAALGWAAIPAVLGMVAAVGLLGLTLVGLSMLVQGPVAIGMIILSGAFLAISTSAMIMGQGLKLGAEAFLIMIDAANAFIDLNIVAIGDQVRVAAQEALRSSGDLFLAGTALVAAGTALIAGAGMISAGAIAMIAAGVAVLPASLALATAAVSFSASTLLMGDVAGTIYNIGVKIGVGGTQLLVGVRSVEEAIAYLDLINNDFRKIITGFSTILLSLDANVTDGLIRFSSTMEVIGAQLSKNSSVFKESLVSLISSVNYFDIIVSKFSINAVHLYNSSVDLHNSSKLLYIAGESMARSGDLLIIGFSKLEMGANAGLEAIRKLNVINSLLLPLSAGFVINMLSMEMTLSRFYNVIPKVDRIGFSISRLALAIASLNSVSAEPLSKIADDGLKAVPKLQVLATEMEDVSSSFAVSSANFSLSSSNLASSVDLINAAMDAIELHGVSFEDKLDDTIKKFEHYANVVEATVARIEAAIAIKAVTAIKDANKFGLDDAIKTEAISTVQVMNEKEGDNRDGLEDLITKNNILLSNIIEILKIMASGGQLQEIKDVIEMLSEEMNHGKSDLANSLNQWIK